MSQANHYAGNRIAKETFQTSPAWLSQYDWSILLVFLHIPKAAGTSFKGVLAQAYGRHFQPYNGHLTPGVLEKYNPSNSSELLALSSHHGFGFHRLFGSTAGKMLDGDGIFSGRDVRYLTMLRDPIDRMVSLYNFVTTFPKHRLHKETAGMEVGEFFRYMDRIGNQAICNQQYALVCGLRQKRDMAKAKDILQGMFVAGPMERSADVVTVLQSELRWPPEIAYQIRNSSPKKLNNRAQLPSDILQMLIDRNELDLELYEHSKTVFENKWGHLLKELQASS